MTKASYVIVHTMCKDGVLRSFHDPVALQERRDALRDLKGKYPDMSAPRGKWRLVHDGKGKAKEY